MAVAGQSLGFAHGVRRRRLAGQAVGAAVALAAGLYQAVNASLPLNDDFMHVAMARQLLAGDWPVRDFFDMGLTLMYGLSALSQSIFGYRLLAEAVIVGVTTAIATYLVFGLVRRLTGSPIAGLLAALLVMVAGPRGYSYPKIIVYAVAAELWWAYVSAPSRAKALLLGAWTAAAFYWRPDHGAYVALGVVLAMVAAHGIRLVTLARCCLAGMAAAVLVVPFFLFVAATMGLAPYVHSGAAIAEAQHVQMDTHAVPAWPIRRMDDVIRLETAEEFAPIVSVRWRTDSPPAARAAVIARYGLTPVSDEDDSVQRVRLSERSFATLGRLVNEPIVEDTAGIDRSSGALPWAIWPAWQRWRFDHWWLRVHLFPGVDEHTRAGEATAAIFYALPILGLLVALPRMRRHLAAEATSGRLVAFALFAIVADLGLLRTPYNVRAVDGVVMPAIMFGCLLATAWRAAAAAPSARRWVVRAATVVAIVLVVKSVAVAGQFGERIAWLSGDGRSMERAVGAWIGARDRLAAEPPLRYWEGHPAPASIRLASYAHACVPPSDRLLVLWFAPEIYYYADRLMAARHLVFPPGYQRLVNEQRLALAKIERYAPPIALANSSLESNTRDVYPSIVDYVHRDYKVAATVQEDGERYLILTRHDRPAVSRWGDASWPCYN